MKVYAKTPAEILDYGWNWGRWLGTDTILSSVWIVPAGLTVVSAGNDATTVSFFASGGVLGDARRIVTNRITSVGGRTTERVFAVDIVEYKAA
jgi:hypothetical protein